MNGTFLGPPLLRVRFLTSSFLVDANLALDDGVLKVLSAIGDLRLYLTGVDAFICVDPRGVFFVADPGW